jgi:hypothetical protein
VRNLLEKLSQLEQSFDYRMCFGDISEAKSVLSLAFQLDDARSGRITGFKTSSIGNSTACVRTVQVRQMVLAGKGVDN